MPTGKLLYLFILTFNTVNGTNIVLSLFTYLKKKKIIIIITFFFFFFFY